MRTMFTHKSYMTSRTNALLWYKLLKVQRMQIPQQLRQYHKNKLEKTVILTPSCSDEQSKNEEPVHDIYRGVSDFQIIFSSYVNDHIVNLNYSRRRKLEEKLKQVKKEKMYEKSVPLIIEKFVLSEKENTVQKNANGALEEHDTVTNYPYSQTEDSVINHVIPKSTEDEVKLHSAYSEAQIKEEIKLRLKAYDQGILQEEISLESNLDSTTWEYYDFENADKEKDEMEKILKGYGTADPNIPVSQVPCGGCGAHLHCQEPALAGFVSKEQFIDCHASELRGVLCQRCYFLKHCNTALHVRVSPELYPKLLEPIKDRKALALVVIDLMDMPCSVWLNLIDILGTQRPVVIVGNKVDLLPPDGKNHLQRVRDSLMAVIKKTSLGKANIKHVALVSAYTGFGIESLITKIQHSWAVKGDIYLLGCTNSGKSSLFNALLMSDLCKTRASSLIPSATVSPWPGTTLNMLKFPVLRPSGYRHYLRVKRLIEERREKPKADQQVFTKNPVVATLSGQIGRTFSVKKEPNEASDPFSLSMKGKPNAPQQIVGINPSNPDYTLGKWCYDTPGTVQPDQIINLLTHEELMKVLPRHCILPCTFCLQSGHTLFVGGLARLDLLYSPCSVRFTVFRSPHVPVNIVRTVDAAAFYRTYLGSELLGVPAGNEERMQNWPVFKPVDFRMYSARNNTSCADVVLSSAGWVSVTGVSNMEMVVEVRGWTPGGRGCHLRQPSVLPYAVTLRGHRKRHSVTYGPHKIFITKRELLEKLGEEL